MTSNISEKKTNCHYDRSWNFKHIHHFPWIWSLIINIQLGHRHLVQDHAFDERGRVRPPVHWQQRAQQGVLPVAARWLGVGVLHRPAAALSRPHPATAPLRACRPISAGLEDMHSRPLPEVPSARDGFVRQPCRDLQARVAHHSSPRSHAIRAEHHRQWGGFQVPPQEDRPNRRLQGSSCWCPAPNVLCQPGRLPRLCDYTLIAAHLHGSCGGKEFGRCQGRRR